VSLLNSVLKFLFFACALPLAALPSNDFTASVQKNFAVWDLNRDGLLVSNELDAAVADTHWVWKDAAAIAALKRASRPKKGAPTPPPLTLTNIATAVAQHQPDLALMFREGLKQIGAATNRALFPAGLPALETIHQGRLGNCFCLAPLGAMVHRDPAEVAALFTAETNGFYSVRLGKKTVEVAPMTDAEIAMTSSNEREGVWVNLFEKAVGTARNEDKPAGQRASSPLDVIARGGSAGTLLAYITGHDIARFPFQFAKSPVSATNSVAGMYARLQRQLAAATKERRLMTCGTSLTSTPGLTSHHAYAVLEYDTVQNAVRLWNPHGQDFNPRGAPGLLNGYPTRNGIFKMPLREFVLQFSGMAFEQGNEKMVPNDLPSPS